MTSELPDEAPTFEHVAGLSRRKNAISNGLPTGFAPGFGLRKGSHLVRASTGLGLACSPTWPVFGGRERSYSKR